MLCTDPVDRTRIWIRKKSKSEKSREKIPKGGDERESSREEWKGRIILDLPHLAEKNKENRTNRDGGMVHWICLVLAFW